MEDVIYVDTYERFFCVLSIGVNFESVCHTNDPFMFLGTEMVFKVESKRMYNNLGFELTADIFFPVFVALDYTVVNLSCDLHVYCIIMYIFKVHFLLPLTMIV